MTETGTVGGALAAAARRLAAAGIDEAGREARLLIAFATGAERSRLLLEPGRALDAAAKDRLAAALARRCRREPISHILGRREFWSLEFAVTSATLDPRPDSETLIEAALAACPDRDAALSALDLGTGTGCLLLAFLSERPAATGLGVDVSPEAVAVARENADANRLSARARFVVADWTAPLAGRFDVILANPPYIPSGEIAALAPEVARYEPRRALDGGPDGLASHRALAPRIAERLAPSGRAFVEIGEGQSNLVAALMAAAGLVVVERRRDLAGRIRCLCLRHGRD